MGLPQGRATKATDFFFGLNVLRIMQPLSNGRQRASLAAHRFAAGTALLNLMNQLNAFLSF